MKYTPAHFLGPHRLASVLIVVEAQPLTAELFAQYAILFLKIVDDILLVLVQPAREGNQPIGERDQKLNAWRHHTADRRGKKGHESNPQATSPTGSSFKRIEYLDTHYKRAPFLG
jgi:hypothetical protein